MRRTLIITLATILVAGTAVAGSNLVRAHLGGGDAAAMKATAADLKAKLQLLYGAQGLGGTVYVGSEFCLACHKSYTGWRDTVHANMHMTASDGSADMDPIKGIIYDVNDDGINDFKQGLDFNAISSAFDPFKPNAPILSYAEGQPFPYRVTIGAVTYKIVVKEGGYFQQRLITRVPVTDGAADGLSKSLYMLPFAYGPRYKSMALYNADKWYVYNGSTPTNQPRITGPVSAATVAGIGRSWSQKCSGCHATGYSSKLLASGEWLTNMPPQVLFQPGDPRYFDVNGDGFMEFPNVGCESCHGAGGAHVLGAGDPAKIINPKNLDPLVQNNLCGQCHSRGASKPAAVHDFPYDETNDKPYQIGDDLGNYLSDAPGLWPDGKTPAKGEEQWQAQKSSLHWGAQSYQKVLCSDCHDPHNGQRGMPRQSFQHNGTTFATSFRDDTMCLACHATHGLFKDITVAMVKDYPANRQKIGEIVSAHTHHPYNPEGIFGVSSCVGCHMPKTGKRDWAYDQTSHTMEAVPPGKTLQYVAVASGMPSSCTASCHSGRPWNGSPIMGDDTWEKWGQKGDKITAKLLEHWYGPGGIWWNTTPPASAGGAWLASAPTATDAEHNALELVGRPD